MEMKDNEHVDKAIVLWNAAHQAVEAKNIPQFLTHILKFHQHMDEHKLFVDNNATKTIKENSRKFTNETYLYRILSVLSSLSKDSPHGSDIATQISTLKVLSNRFLDYSSQDKFSPDTQLETLDWDKNLAYCVMLHCTAEKVKAQISSHFRESDQEETLLKTLYGFKNCDAIVTFYKRTLCFNMNKQVLFDIDNNTQKAFIIQFSDYSGCKKLVECDHFNEAISTDSLPALIKLRSTVESNYLERFNKMPLEEKLREVQFILDNHLSNKIPGHESPTKLSDFTQRIIYELLKSTSFTITPQMKILPQHALEFIQQTVDSKLEQLAKPRSNSVINIAKDHISGQAKERKTLTRAKSELVLAITKEQKQSGSGM